MTTDDTDTDDGFGIDRRTVLQLAGAVGLGAAMSRAALAGETSTDPTPVDPERPPPWAEGVGEPAGWADDRWFVELPAEPTARGGRPDDHAAERARLRDSADDAGVAFDERRDFSTLWNGLSVAAGLVDAYALSGLDGVEAVYPVALVGAPDPEEVAPELDTAAAMTGADRARLELGYTGAGTSVAIVDTGIDYNHPDLGGGGDPTVEIEADDDRSFDHPRISHGWDYVGEELADPEPDPDPMDPHGHGTHVAGIAGAAAADEDGVTGVAPGVEFGAYKVFPATGPTTADIIVDALEDAYVDGMDVVNMSIGSTLAWGQQYPTTATSNELVAQGVVVTNSAGNDAALGTYTLSPPGNAHDAISVASVENEFFQAPIFRVDELADPVPYDAMAGADAPPTEGESAPLALPAKSEIAGEEGYFGCEPEDFADFPDGHVALVERGHCFFSTKYTNAVEAGASGVLVFNEQPGLFFGTIQEAGVEGVWCASTTRDAGLALADLVATGEEVRLTYTDETAKIPNPDGGLLSGFSSYGQTVELAFGPNLAAPGGAITSTYPLEEGEYAVLSGTSMAAPHAAGAAALLLEAEGADTDPIDVRDRLQNTADPMPWSLAPGFGFADQTHRQGAGLIQVDDAIEADQRVDPGQLSVGEGAGASGTLSLRNDGDEPVTYTVEHGAGDVPFGPLGTSIDPFSPVFLVPGSTLDAPETVTVPAGGTAEVDVSVGAPGYGLPNHQYGGFVTLRPDAESAATLQVPYAGYDGEYQDLPLFGYYTGFVEFVEQKPRLSRILYDEDGEVDGFEPVEPGHEFTVAEDDVPVVEAFFGHFPHVMRMTAVHSDSGERWPVFESRFLPRSPGPDTYYPFAWPGTTAAGGSGELRPVQSGTYTLEVEALRALGDPSNPDHWDTWESPPFELDTRRAEKPVGMPVPASDTGD